MKVNISLDREDLLAVMQDFAKKKCRRLFAAGRFDLAIIDDPLPNELNITIAGHAWPEDNPFDDDAGEEL